MAVNLVRVRSGLQEGGREGAERALGPCWGRGCPPLWLRAQLADVELRDRPGLRIPSLDTPSTRNPHLLVCLPSPSWLALRLRMCANANLTSSQLSGLEQVTFVPGEAGPSSKIWEDGCSPFSVVMRDEISEVWSTTLGAWGLVTDDIYEVLTARWASFCKIHID